MIIAIDGPAGSGKSTIARAVAARTDATYLDTGAMYRSVALLALRAGADLDDQDAVTGLASHARIEFAPADNGEQAVILNGAEVTADIRTPEVDAAVSYVARMQPVRDLMVAKQRDYALGTDVVCEGRDIGTVVFPQADVKIFMTASPLTRARRRAQQNIQRGCPPHECDVDAILQSILERDRIDSTRDASPLKAADDAVHVDSSDLSIDEVVTLICGLIDDARVAKA